MDIDHTPRPPQRSVSKKRLSEGYVLGQDDSFTEGRGPRKSVNINDDMAEKRRRRKSAKVAMTLEGDVSFEANVGSQGDDPSNGAAAGRKQQLASIAQTPVINVPLDVMNSNFEEWMKMATDNKINAANSWNFALIDYFHDMSLLRNNTDNSINFQRASCTLDGCVKIWTSRVDSVGTETGKLLSNLATEGRGDGKEQDENPDDPDGQDPGRAQRKRKAHRPESTLAKSVQQLRNKKLDLEFTVDPLFRKTCADFDEGGAQGLLMNHLSLGVGVEGSLRVIFDASDMRKADEEDEPLEEPEDKIDLSELRKQFLPNWEVLQDKAISHSLEGFSFSKNSFSLDDTSLFRDDPPQFDDAADDDDDDAGDLGVGDNQDVLAGLEDNDQGPPVEDFFVGDQAVGDDYVDVGFPPDDIGADGQDGEHGEFPPGEGVPGGLAPFDARRIPNERDLVMAMTDGDGSGGGLMMDYFDQSFLKNWAGPEHWKLRKVVRRPDAEPAPKAKREKKEAFKIDFLTPSEKGLKAVAKQLFAPVTRGAGINLPGPSTSKGGRGRKAKEKEKRNDQTLPDDMHFSSRQLVSLFLKPKFSLQMRGRRIRQGEPGEVDENFWAQAAANQAAGQVENVGDETANGGAIPFHTQFFHDDFDDGPGFDDVFDGADGEPGVSVEPGEQDLLAATQGMTRRVRPEAVNYAKRAKRVDVRKLKENIWKSLDIVVPETLDEERNDDEMEVDGRPPTHPAEARDFTTVITGLQKTYPPEKMEEISTSFCFICLLHLANEQGLKLQTGGEILDPEEKDQKVGRIWDLKVYRDPSATPAG